MARSQSTAKKHVKKTLKVTKVIKKAKASAKKATTAKAHKTSGPSYKKVPFFKNQKDYFSLDKKYEKW